VRILVQRMIVALILVAILAGVVLLLNDEFRVKFFSESSSLYEEPIKQAPIPRRAMRLDIR
jgi:hypothetical protein